MRRGVWFTVVLAACAVPERDGLFQSDGGADAGTVCPEGRRDLDGDGECECVIEGPDVCDLVDNDCDPSTPNGSASEGFGARCDGIDADLCEDGSVGCIGGVLACDDASDDDPDVCNGADDDCDPSTPDGSGDPRAGTGCDGDDPDDCAGGLFVCDAGALRCDDPGGAGQEICDGVDNDCDPSTPDGAADPMDGAACDGPDADRCDEGTLSCSGGALSCSDRSGDNRELCNGMDDDCRSDTPDGTGEATLGMACDGADTDLCAEGVIECQAGVLRCGDTTGDDRDLCNGMDDDCDPASADGSEDDAVGMACDGADADACTEGVVQCVGGGTVCGDMSGDNLELCNDADDDCRPGTADGADDSRVGVACDGEDTDACLEGIVRCVAGGLIACDDATGDDLDFCNGLDDDCRPETLDGSADPLVGVPCDGPDADLCEEGTSSCMAGEVLCDDLSGDDVEECNDVDDDCDGEVDEAVSRACANDCGTPGTEVCDAGEFADCDAPPEPDEECNGLDDDCDGEVDEAACVGCAPFDGAGRIYLVCLSTTWALARDACDAAGYSLVTIDDAAEQTLLEDTVASDREYWIGLNDRAVEGSYEWVDGTAFSFSSWDTSEPRASSSDDCVRMDDGPGRMADWEVANCLAFERFICEADDPRVP
ncbi:MAG: C-type lectin domain-containing protein [Myxococcota bacterium]